MKMHWKIFVDANTIKNSEKIMKWFLDKLNINFDSLVIEPYRKGGHTCSFQTETEGKTWNEIIFNSLIKAQSVGYSWTLTSDITKEIDLWSNESNITGVKNIQLIVIKNA